MSIFLFWENADFLSNIRKKQNYPAVIHIFHKLSTVIHKNVEKHVENMRISVDNPKTGA